MRRSDGSLRAADQVACSVALCFQRLGTGGGARSALRSSMPACGAASPTAKAGAKAKALPASARRGGGQGAAAATTRRPFAGFSGPRDVVDEAFVATVAERVTASIGGSVAGAGGGADVEELEDRDFGDGGLGIFQRCDQMDGTEGDTDQG